MENTFLLLPIVKTKEGVKPLVWIQKAKSNYIDAMRMVTATRIAIESKGANKKHCAIITLDVNNANLGRIIETLCRLGITDYPSRMIRSYFTNSQLCYHTTWNEKVQH